MKATEIYKVGDIIECDDKEQMAERDRVLCQVYGYQTEYCFERNGKHGLWIVIEGVPNE